MSTVTRTTVTATLSLAVFLSANVLLLKKVDALRKQTTAEDVLHIPSPQVVKRLSVGYSGLLADIYWTRVVQYFGSLHHERSTQYKLLSPLLDITTTLDPKLSVAYEFGSLFLSQKPPEGAGDPQAAIRLVEHGIEQNPTAWRLYYHLGYIYWLELKDPAKASEAFRKGSEIPGAQPWMKVMSAALAQRAGDEQTARYMWTNILSSTDDPAIRGNAEKRLVALRVDSEVGLLQQRVERFTQLAGRQPANWNELIAVGLLRRIPEDPLGSSYLLKDGHIEVAHPDQLPFITHGLPPGKKSTDRPDIQSVPATSNP